MDSSKHKRHHSKKDKTLINLIKPTSESDDESSEHELSYYINDRVKLMKEVLKIIKPKKIKSMAPDCMKRMDIEEINSMLLEELLGISNKRLKYIFNGQSLNEESSSTDPEDQPIDVISLDDISDDDLIIDLDSDSETYKKKKHKTKIKEEPKKKKIKKEKHDKDKDVAKHKKEEGNQKHHLNDESNLTSEKNLMSVLELLELQARARAIRSQLALESIKSVQPESNKVDETEDDDEDAVIVESPKNEEIIITSTDSEPEEKKIVDKEKSVESDLEREKNAITKNKIKVIQQSSINKLDTNTFWKDSDKNIGNNSSNIRILQQTTIKEANKNKCESIPVHQETNTRISEIPLPENQQYTEKDTEINKKEVVKTKQVTNEKVQFLANNELKSNGPKEIMTPEFRKRNGNSAVTSQEKEMVSEKLIQIENQAVDESMNTQPSIKIETNEFQNKDIVDKNDVKELVDKVANINSNSEDCVKRCIKKTTILEPENMYYLDDNESIILNVDQSEMDCINID